MSGSVQNKQNSVVLRGGGGGGGGGGMHVNSDMTMIMICMYVRIVHDTMKG